MSWRPAIVPSTYTQAQLRRFLHKIQYPGFVEQSGAEEQSLPEPTLATLSLVQIHCLTTFAFESLSLHYESHEGRSGAMCLDAEYVLRRYVDQALGGGYCFQSNYLLLEMLRALRFRAFPVLGRVCHGVDEAGRDAFGGLTHMAVLVYLPCHLVGDVPPRMSYYLVDIGFGRTIHRPMLLAQNHTEEACAHVFFTIDKSPLHSHSCFESIDSVATDQETSAISRANTDQCWRLRRTHGETTQTCYMFQPTECFPPDFAVSNIAASTSLNPAISPFSNTVLVCKYFFTRDDSIEWSSSPLYPYAPSHVVQKTLAGTVYKNPQGDTTEIQTEEERVEVLKREFGLLAHVSTSDAVRTIQDKPSAIAQSTLS